MRLNSVALLSLVATALAAKAPFKIDFEVRRGESKDDLSPEDDSNPRFVKRDGSLDMTLTNKQTFYMATLKIGSNEDENRVLVDTGSSDLWVMSHDLKCVSAPNSKRNERSFGHGTGVKLNERELLQKRKNLYQPSRTIETDEEKEASEKIHNKLFGFGSIYSTVYITEGPGAYSTFSPFVGTEGGSSGSGGSNTCTSYGSFNTENSDTFKKNNTNDFEIQYADDTSAIGIWGYDDVTISNVTVKDLSFAIANETSSDVGVLGIGLPGLEVTTQYGYTYQNLPLKLKADGIIAKSLYSLYLNTADAKAGSILFGAIDHAKYQGDLVTVKMMRTYSQISYPVRIQVPVSKIDVESSSGSTTNILSSTTGVVLDTGSTLSYVFSDTLQSLGKALNGQYSNSVGAYVVNCNLADSSRTVDIEFGGNKTIKVPISDLVLQASKSTCILGVMQQSSSSSYMLFGDNILRSAYIVYDLDDYEVSLAQVSYTNKESIEVIGASGITNSSGSGTTSSSGTSTSTSTRHSAGSIISKPVYGLLLSLLISYYVLV
ncbi:candidapepsin-9 [Candida albicans GC75]|nr:candidapepsin-9 [Candida albicans GC75]